MQTIVHARYSLNNGAFAQDLSVCVDGEYIVDAGAYSDLTSRYPEAERVGGDDYILVPAFTNAHDHGRAVGTLALGIPDDFLELWLSDLARMPGIPPYLASLHSGLQLLQSGVTAVAHSHNPVSWTDLASEIPQAIRGYADAGVRVAMHPPIVDQNLLVYAERERFLDFLPAYIRARLPESDMIAPDADEYFAILDDLYDNFHDSARHRAHIQVSPAGGQWCSDPLIIRACQWAQERGTRVQMHMLETRYQSIYARKTWGKNFIGRLDDIGALGDWLTLAHMVWVEDDEIELLAERGAGVAHNISSNLRLRSGFAPIAEMVAAGVPVGIGLDGHTLDDDQDFLREMRLVWTIANRSGMASPDLSADALWNMGGAVAAAISFGADAPLGRLEAGGLADLVLLDWASAKGKWSPADYPPAALLPEFLLRRIKRDHVRHVMRGGEWLICDGEHVNVDIEDVEREIWERLEFEGEEAPSQLGSYLRRFYRHWDDAESPSE